MIDPCAALYTKATILTSASRSLCSIVRAFGVLISFGRSTPHQIKNGGEAGTKGTVPSVLTYCGTQRAVLEVTYKVCALDRSFGLEARRDSDVRRTGSEPALHYTELRGFQHDLT